MKTYKKELEKVWDKELKKAKELRKACKAFDEYKEKSGYYENLRLIRQYKDKQDRKMMAAFILILIGNCMILIASIIRLIN